MGKKRKTIRFGSWEAVVEIDHDGKNTLAVMEDQVLFWHGGERRLAEAGGDVEKAYLKQLGQELVSLSMDLTTDGIKAHFDGLDGWGPLDGRYGVTLVSVDRFEIGDDEIEILG